MYTSHKKVRDVYTTSLTNDEIEKKIKLYTSIIDNYVGYKLGFIYSDPKKNVFFDGSGTEILPLTIWISYDEGTYENDVVIPVKHYPYNEINGGFNTIIKKQGIIKSGHGNIELRNCTIGRFGCDYDVYGDETTLHYLPIEILELCTRLVIADLKLQTQEVGHGNIITKENIGSYSVEYDNSNMLKSFSFEINSILNKYKSVSIA